MATEIWVNMGPGSTDLNESTQIYSTQLILHLLSITYYEVLLIKNPSHRTWIELLMKEYDHDTSIYFNIPTTDIWDPFY